MRPKPSGLLLDHLRQNVPPRCDDSQARPTALKQRGTAKPAEGFDRLPIDAISSDLDHINQRANGSRLPLFTRAKLHHVPPAE
jgi:hypothetical protein